MSEPTRRFTTIALMNQKGGVGKTTTCANLGAAIAERGKNVCLVDLDPQAHLTINFGIDVDDDALSLYDLLTGEATFLETVRTLEKFPQSPGNVAVLPGHTDLAALEGELASAPDRHRRLADVLLRAEHDFDYVLIDCPPSLGLLTLNGLTLAGEVLIPMQPHFFALQGFAKLVETIEGVREAGINPDLKVLGLLLTMFDANTRLAGDVIAELEAYLAAQKDRDHPCGQTIIFDTRVRRNIKLAESPSFGEPITVYDSASNGAADYRRLAEEVLTAHGHLTPPAEATLPPVPQPQPTVKVAEIDQSKLRAAEVGDGGGRIERPETPLDKPVETPFGV